MKITKIQLYILFGFSILLTLLQINTFFNLLGLFLTCFIISYNCFKDITQSIKYGFFLLIVLSLVGILLKVNRYTFDKEHLIIEKLNETNTKNHDTSKFESKNDALKNKQDTVKNVGKKQNNESYTDIDDIENTENKSNKNDSILDTFTNKETDILNDYLNNIDINDTDEKYPDTKYAKDMSPAQAQRELYKLIDTTNLLKQTMTEMTPIINEGKKIIKSIDTLNLLG